MKVGRDREKKKQQTTWLESISGVEGEKYEAKPQRADKLSVRLEGKYQAGGEEDRYKDKSPFLPVSLRFPVPMFDGETRAQKEEDHEEKE